MKKIISLTISIILLSSQAFSQPLGFFFIEPYNVTDSYHEEWDGILGNIDFSKLMDISVLYDPNTLLNAVGVVKGTEELTTNKRWKTFRG
jgi:hypothetical protein